MDKSLRILAIVDLPWDRRLGAARIYIELATRWNASGHSVEKFCLTDAFPKPTNSRWLSALRQGLFPFWARRYVRRNAGRFDVIDALIGTLPFSKNHLGFDGLLVARSVAIYRASEQFIRFSLQRWPEQSRGKILGRYFHRLKRRWLRRNSDLSVRNCDLLNLPNAQELEFLPEAKRPAVIQSYGITESERAALATAAQSTLIRLRTKEICFIGMWGLRKGAGDWPVIVHRIREMIPEASFKFLGTMTSAQTVLGDLNLGSTEGISCVPTYDPEELPVLLGSCAVGLFPSYIEGFGLAVLEQLASGIPTVAYDVPGPRHILQSLRETLLVPLGDTGAMASRASEILRMNPADYEALSTRCRSSAAEFRWESVAVDTIRHYRSAIEKLRSA